jgi:hypothetical protein
MGDPDPAAVRGVVFAELKRVLEIPPPPVFRFVLIRNKPETSGGRKMTLWRVLLVSRDSD